MSVKIEECRATTLCRCWNLFERNKIVVDATANGLMTSTGKMFEFAICESSNANVANLSAMPEVGCHFFVARIVT